MKSAVTVKYKTCLIEKAKENSRKTKDNKKDEDDHELLDAVRRQHENLGQDSLERETDVYFFVSLSVETAIISKYDAVSMDVVAAKHWVGSKMGLARWFIL